MESAETVASGETLGLDGLETNVALGRWHLSVLKLMVHAIMRSNHGDSSVGEYLTVDRPQLQHCQSHYSRCRLMKSEVSISTSPWSHQGAQASSRGHIESKGVAKRHTNAQYTTSSGMPSSDNPHSICSA